VARSEIFMLCSRQKSRAMVAYALGPKIRDIGSKMFSKSRFNNTFDEFRYDRQIRNRTIV